MQQDTGKQDKNIKAKQQQQQIEADLINALQQDAVDTDYQSETFEWDGV